MSTQPAPTPAPASQPTAQQVFDAAYWAHQPPAVQALPGLTDTRQTVALELAQQGYIIDVPIMVWGWDAYQTMVQRAQYGYTWVPSALMPPVTMAPGLTVPGAVPYDPNDPPPGAILVSTNPADYPPYKTPIPVPAAPPASLVGAEVGSSNVYQAYPAALQQLTNGEAYTGDPRGTFVFHLSVTPFGQVYWFTLQTPAA